MATTKTKHRRTSHGTQKPSKGLADRIALIEKSMLRTDFPDFSTGDTIRVQVRIKEGEKERIQAFEGVVIARGNKGASKSFTVRKMSHGVGVERIFMEASPKVAKVEMVTPGRVRRSKLYYIRDLQGKAAKIDRELETHTAQEPKAATPTTK